jgi:hypothetical protein
VSLLRQVTNRKYETTANDLSSIGYEVERILDVIKEKEYGFYDCKDLELSSKIALRVVEGMKDWQWEQNKGVRLNGDTNIRLEVYELHELQKRIDSSMEIDLFE